MLSTTDFSNFSAANQAPQPRAIVTINDIAILWQNITVTTTTFYLADNYRVVIPISGQPTPIDLNYLVRTIPMTIKIYMGFPSNPLSFTTADLELKMVGDVDRLDVDPLSFTATLTGRDLTSRLIDIKTYQKYPNQSAASIATLLSQEHNLTPDVVTNEDSNQKVGIFYTTENVLMTRETTEWDLLCFLAQQIDFVCYVQEQTLVFKPRPTPENAVNPFVLKYVPPTVANASPTFDGMSLTVSRSLTLAKDVLVKIRVPVGPNGKAFTQPVSAPRVRASSPGTQIYVFTFPGLTKQQALVRGQQLLRDITIHELILNAKIPGNTKIQKDTLIQLQGTQSALDQFYYADHVEHTMDIDGGFEINLSARNHSVDSEVSL